MPSLRKDKQTEIDKQTSPEKETDRQTNRETKTARQEKRWLVGWFSFMTDCSYGWLLLLMFGCLG